MNDEPRDDGRKPGGPPEEHHHGLHHGHGPRHAPHGGIHEHRAELLERHASEDISDVRTELAEAIEKKELHVHRAHAWLHKLNHASAKILRMHEEALDNLLPQSADIHDALEAIFDADRQIVGVAKAISDSGREVKGDNFDKADILGKLKSINASLDKAVRLLPEEKE